MSKQVQFRRGTTAQHAAFTGAVGEITVDTTKKTAVVHDGATAGGLPLSRDDHRHESLSGGIRGLLLANNTTDTLNDIDIAVGAARDSTNTLDLVLPSGITKRLDAAWIAGTGNGGLDTGAKAASTGYHVYLIRRASDGAIDALFSTSATNPAMPTGWTHRRRIGSITTDVDGNIRPFHQTGGWFRYKGEPPRDSVNQVLSAPFLQALSLPSGIKYEVLLACVTSEASSLGGWVQIRDPDLGAPVTTSNGMGAYYRFSGTSLQGFSYRVHTNASRQIYIADRQTTATLSVYTQAYFDHRDEYL